MRKFIRSFCNVIIVFSILFFTAYISFFTDIPAGASNEIRQKLQESKYEFEDYSSNFIINDLTIKMNTYYYEKLTDDQKKELAYLAFLEQETIEGGRIELSLAANLAKRDGYDNVYSYVTKDEPWFQPVWTGEIYDVHYNPDPDFNLSKYLEIVEEVLVQGYRYLPENVDEHDCYSDISYISTGSVYDESRPKAAG